MARVSPTFVRTSTPEFWEDVYARGGDGWELGRPAPPLVDILDSSPPPSRSSARSTRSARRADGRDASGWSSRARPARDTLRTTFFRGGPSMKSARMILATALVLAVAVASTWAPRADAQGQTIKIGVLYDHSGPFSAAGSLNCWRGAKMIIDYVNEKGGVLGKYKIVQVDGDGQSKAEVAINEADRLLHVEKVNVLAGVYSSAHAVPLAEKVDKQKKFLWITTAIADAVLKDRHLQYTFRPQANGGSFGENSVAYVAHYSQDKLKKPAKDVRAAIIYEDGPYGAGVAAANEAEAKKQGMQVVLKEGYSIQAPRLSR